MKSKVKVVCVVYWVASIVLGVIEGRERTRQAPMQIVQIERIQDLYYAGQFEQVLKDCDKAESIEALAKFEPNILYLRWAANWRLSRVDEAERVENILARRYPKHLLVANVRFQLAVDLIGHGKYIAARDELASIEREFSGTSIARSCRQIANNLSTALPEHFEPSSSRSSL